MEALALSRQRRNGAKNMAEVEVDRGKSSPGKSLNMVKKLKMEKGNIIFTNN